VLDLRDLDVRARHLGAGNTRERGGEGEAREPSAHPTYVITRGPLGKGYRMYLARSSSATSAPSRSRT
jgi:hypothetical protein